MLVMAAAYTTSGPSLENTAPMDTVRPSTPGRPPIPGRPQINLTNSMSLTQLDNGIHMTKTLEAGIIAGYWRLVVILKDPDDYQRSRLKQVYVNDMKEFVSTVGKEEPPLDPGTQSQLEMRINWLLELMENDEQRFRVKRGLIDAGGWLLGRVFGLATGDEVNELKDMVIDGYQQTTALSHRVDKMSSTVNQMIDEQVKTRKYLSQHKRAIEQLEKAVRDVIVDMNITFITIFKSERFSNWVTAVERKYELERRAKEDYRQKRISLETGRLTEHVMPRNFLTEITEKIVEAGYLPATLEWYYENCIVRPLWGSGAGMGYMVELPVTLETAVAYNIQTFPFVQGDQGWLKLIVNPRVGYDQTVGTLTVLKECMGHNPMLCEKNLRYHSGMRCERSLIIGSKDGLDYCSVKSETPARTYVTPLHINKYILTTTDSFLELRCADQPTKQIDIRPGSYVLDFHDPSCQLQGTSGWVLDSLTVHQSEAELSASVVDTSAIAIPQIPRAKELPTLAIDQLHQIDGIQIDKLRAMPAVPVLSVPNHASVNSYVLIIVIIMILTLCLVLFIRWVRETKRHLRWAKSCAACCKKATDNKKSDPDPTVATIENVYEMETTKPEMSRRVPRELVASGPPIMFQTQPQLVHGAPPYPYPVAVPPYPGSGPAVPMDPRVASPAYNPASSGATPMDTRLVSSSADDEPITTTTKSPEIQDGNPSAVLEPPGMDPDTAATIAAFERDSRKLDTTEEELGRTLRWHLKNGTLASVAEVERKARIAAAMNQKKYPHRRVLPEFVQTAVSLKRAQRLAREPQRPEGMPPLIESDGPGLEEPGIVRPASWVTSCDNEVEPDTGRQDQLDLSDFGFGPY